MDTIVRKMSENNIDIDSMMEASRILRSGGLVAIPTETVYGLAGDALSAQASGKIYAAKGRPSDNPLIVHIAREEDLSRIAKNISLDTQKLMKAAGWGNCVS